MRVGAQHSRKPGRVHLLVHVPQALRPVADQRALNLGALQDVGAVDVLGIEGRILAHQNHVEFTQFGVLSRAPREPCSRIVEHLQGGEAAPGDAVAQPKVLLFGIKELPAARLRRQQYRQGAVLGGLYRFDGVHDHDETDSGRHVHCLRGPKKIEKRISTPLQSSARPSAGAPGSLEKTVNHATVVWASLPRNVDPVPWLARPGYVKKPQDSSTYAHEARPPGGADSRADSWRA